VLVVPDLGFCLFNCYPRVVGGGCGPILYSLVHPNWNISIEMQGNLIIVLENGIF